VAFSILKFWVIKVEKDVGYDKIDNTPLKSREITLNAERHIHFGYFGIKTEKILQIFLFMKIVKIRNKKNFDLKNKERFDW